MKTARLLRWSGAVLSPRTRPSCKTLPCPTHHVYTRQSRIQSRIYPQSLSQIRTQATAAAQIEEVNIDDLNVDDADPTSQPPSIIPEDILTRLPSPPVSASKTSAKLAALHARLSLPSRLPLETLARTLVDVSADTNSKFNNAAFGVLGADLLSHYTSEYLICQFPRLPLAVVFAAMNAYVGPKALATMTREWGVQAAAAPGGEVDPGFLQFKHLPPGESNPLPIQDVISAQPLDDPKTGKRRHSISSRTIYDNPFGEIVPRDPVATAEARAKGATHESAAADFVRAVAGAVYLHAGRSSAKKFYRDHFMSRQLNMASLMAFRTPTKDLSRLCAREGFQSPVARIISETGRTSRHPVFIVGVFSGREKLGEGAGSSLDEARTRAAVAALKGWYLYSPVDWRLPSDAEEPDSQAWTSQYVDQGDVVR